MTKRNLNLLFHVHTRASFDSMTAPETILRYCRDNGIHAVAICDHDSLDGSREARRLAGSYGVQVIPAVEISTDAGDIIGLFIDALPTTNDIRDVLHHIRNDCGGLAVLPHPYRGHDLDRVPLEQIDIIETGNARCPAERNRQAKTLAEQHGKPEIVGADAHVPGELGCALNTFHIEAASEHTGPDHETEHIGFERSVPPLWGTTNSASLPHSATDCRDIRLKSAPVSPEACNDVNLRTMLLAAHRTLRCERSPARYSAMSRMIKGIKKRQPRTMLNAGRALLREEAHRRLWRFAGKGSAE